MWVSMSSDDGAVGCQVINIAVAIYIPEVRALRTAHKYRCTATNSFEGTRGAIDTSYNMFECLSMKMFGLTAIHLKNFLSNLDLHSHY
ncbi:hypothetical protein D3C77_476670 [compost metagenome]